ncbi:murein biosynthesis integral membrane protein MurJ [Terrabacter sp. Ter38]|uniref:murein biosynthesis integral membrane protein MurJ n=1 Tax=Terrabacter sp. Ter38 TaxID=2926030 RepID=UPI00211885FE|nr:lipid II flippase MurJ [Terrabacter sp. Ter38]
MTDRTAGGGSASRRGLFAAAGTIAVITLVARVVGFGRWFVFSHSVGATCVGSVYQSVNAVPNVLFEIAAGGVLAAVAVPLVAGALARGDRVEADHTASALLTWVVVVLVPLGLVVALAAEPIARGLLGAGDTCPGAVGLGADLLRVFAIQIPLYGVGIVLGGVLQSHHRFVAAAIAPLMSSLVVIATYVTYAAVAGDPAAPIAQVPAGATTVLAVGTTLGVVALSLPLLVPVRRAGVHLALTTRFPHGVGARVRRLAVAGLLAVAGQQLATLVFIRLANDRGGPGTLNVYTYVQAVSLLPYAVLAVPLATAAFPTLAGSAQSGGPEPETGAAAPLTFAPGSAAVDVLRRTWLATLLAGLLAGGLLVAVARPVGAFFALLDAGRVDGNGAVALSAIPDALVLVAPGIVGLCAIGLLTRASYVRGRARVAGAVVAVAWLATTVVPLVALEGAAGPATTVRALALGTSIGLVAGAVALAVLVARSWGRAALTVPARPVAAGLLGAASAAILGWWLGGLWTADGLLVAAAQGVAVALAATVTLVVVVLLVDRSVVARLRRPSRTAGTAPTSTTPPAPTTAPSSAPMSTPVAEQDRHPAGPPETR